MSYVKEREYLTDREKEILLWSCKGCTSKEIGYRLKITESTVKTHRENIRTVLDAPTMSVAMTIALKQGIIKLGEI